VHKLVLPSILIGTILIGGIFAFIPVDKAITVHTGIIAAIQGGGGIDNTSLDASISDLDTQVTTSETVVTTAINAQDRIILFSYVTGGDDSWPDEFPLTPFVVDGYSGEVSILVSTIPAGHDSFDFDDTLFECDWDFEIGAITDDSDDGSPNTTVSTVSPSDDSRFDTDPIPAGTDQLFLDGDDDTDDMEQICSLAVTLFLEGTNT